MVQGECQHVVFRAPAQQVGPVERTAQHVERLEKTLRHDGLESLRTGLFVRQLAVANRRLAGRADDLYRLFTARQDRGAHDLLTLQHLGDSVFDLLESDRPLDFENRTDVVGRITRIHGRILPQLALRIRQRLETSLSARQPLLQTCP